MAPDLNSLTADGKWDYSTPGSTGYHVPDTTYNDPSLRKIKVLTVGAGVSGIMMAYKLQKHTQNVEHVIYDKNSDLGGTWLENRYPGCACDAPSHSYVYNWALNPDWPRFLSYAPDIWEYLNRVCEVFDLRKYMKFHTEVTSAVWNEETGQWKVSLRRQEPGQEAEEFEEVCDVFYYATGVLNNFQWPKIDGIEKFKGKLIHTARWPKEYQEDAWKNESIAIIGSGASSIQAVPTMQPHAKHMDIFVRTGVWFVQISDTYEQTYAYTEEEKAAFRKDPKALVAHSKDLESQINSLAGIFYTGTKEQKDAHEFFRARTAEFLKDERLLKGFSPEFEIGCRRITPGDPYLKAIQEDNVDVHFTAVTQITEDGVIGADGTERKVDTIVCATGFDVSFKPRFPVVGRDGKDLRERWKVEPEGYLGLAVPELPNFIYFIGPTWPIENGSVAGPLGYVGDYAVQMIQKMQRDQIKSLVPKQDITDSFNAHAQEWYKHTVWKSGCRSWYKNNDTGRINAIWPGSSLHYIEVLKHPRWEDYDIKYLNKNPWAALGMGLTFDDKETDASKKDLCRYLALENVDEKWLKAVFDAPKEE